MDIGHLAERLMGMNDRVWARHMNPLSVWTRLFSAPLWFLALWSYVWLGWLSLVPILIMAVWTYLNPRVFPRPRTLDAWGSKGVLGERVWLARKEMPLPAGFARAAFITSSLSGLFILCGFYGFITRDFWAAVLGWHAAVVAKIWFVDRMVWLWDVTADKEKRLAVWGLSEFIE